ncbi:MAG TPA: LysR family transcriptional regulator [Burkholderiales bacterium]|jgi:DNA-binding transcriptional LysR family regulator|nr:LysR family transcriptional regulator [Burkholderiales bacterium]
MLRKIDWESQIGRRLRLRDLHVFATVVQRGSMAKAAQALGVSQPAVSEVISDLEHVLGVRLLDRSAKGVEPTIYGDALLKRSVAAFDELKQSVRDIAFLSDPTEGELRIGCTDSLSTTILPQIISRFSRQYPGVLVHFDDVGARATEVLGPGLRDRQFDCVLQRIVLPLPEEHSTDDINAEVLFDDELVIAAGSNTRWARRRNIDLAELIDEPWILPPPGTWYHAFVSRLFQARGLEVPKPSLVTHSIALRTRLLTEGSYLTTFASSVVRLNTDRYAIKILPVDFPVQPLPAGVLTLKNRTLSPVVERFLGIARAVAKPLAGRACSSRGK